MKMKFPKIVKEKSRSKLIKELDHIISEKVKVKAKGKCFKCGRSGNGVSHYYSRKYIGTRWSMENLDWSCWACHFHQLEHFKQPGEWYHQYMIKKLGDRGFKTLEIQAHAITKFSRQDILLLIKIYEPK